MFTNSGTRTWRVGAGHAEGRQDVLSLGDAAVAVRRFPTSCLPVQNVEQGAETDPSKYSGGKPSSVSRFKVAPDHGGLTRSLHQLSGRFPPCRLRLLLRAEPPLPLARRD
jgi:hypothetical protein